MKEGNLSTYESYRQFLTSIINLVQDESVEQNAISQDERNEVARIENEFSKDINALRMAESAVREQYSSVWTSCSNESGVILPRDQRPLATEMSWKECIKIQEQAASRIRNWIKEKMENAMRERQRQLIEDEKRKAAMLAAQEEAAKKRAEEMAIAERMRAAAMIEEKKRRFRK